MVWSAIEAELLPLPKRLRAGIPRRRAWNRRSIRCGRICATPKDLLASAGMPRRIGFQGKMCIHPDQIAGANAAFSPDEAAIATGKA